MYSRQLWGAGCQPDQACTIMPSRGLTTTKEETGAAGGVRHQIVQGEIAVRPL